MDEVDVKLITPSEFAICFMPGNPSGLRHLLYAGKPVHRNGLPRNAVAYLPLGERNFGWDF